MDGPSSLDVAELQLAGGGNLDQQQQTIQVQVIQPPTDYTPLIVSGVIVPLLIAAVGWWLQSRWRKANPGMDLSWQNVKKAREK